MKVLFATSEAAPFVKTGGLGDVAGSLPAALREKDVDARVILPLYRCIPQHFKEKMTYLFHIYIDMAWRKQYCGVFQMEYNGCIYYFLDNEFYFNGDTPYSYIHLDCEKFIFFSKALLSVLPSLNFRPDVIHCNDWQTGPVPVFLDTFLDNPFYCGIKTVMTVHNLKFQGRWDLKGIKDAMGISDYYFTSDKLEYYRDANLLKGGLVYANKITTVSSTYAWEITTPEYGEGLDKLLAARRNDLSGIVNGISYTDWNPETDDMIYAKYSLKDVHEKKRENKMALQRDLGLPEDPDTMMIGVVSRLTDQKGFDLVAYVLEQLCQSRVQLVVLGTGDEKYENLFRHYAWKYPDKVSAQIYFSNEMSHKIYAASDAFLMPSRFEPCGLSQLISFRYGTVPIVRETGGLKDTVWSYNEFTGEGTGFSFKNYNAGEMLNIIWYAMQVFYDKKDAWNGLIKTGMESDFSWNISANKYIELYKEMTGIYEWAPLEKKKPLTAENGASAQEEPANEPEEDPSFEETIAAAAEKSTQAIVEEVKEKEARKAETAAIRSGKSAEAEEKPKKTRTTAKKTSTAKKTAAKTQTTAKTKAVSEEKTSEKTAKEPAAKPAAKKPGRPKKNASAAEKEADKAEK